MYSFFFFKSFHKAPKSHFIDARCRQEEQEKKTITEKWTFMKQHHRGWSTVSIQYNIMSPYQVITNVPAVNQREKKMLAVQSISLCHLILSHPPFSPFLAVFFLTLLFHSAGAGAPRARGIHRREPDSDGGSSPLHVNTTRRLGHMLPPGPRVTQMNPVLVMLMIHCEQTSWNISQQIEQKSAANAKTVWRFWSRAWCHKFNQNTVGSFVCDWEFVRGGTWTDGALYPISHSVHMFTSMYHATVTKMQAHLVEL